MKTDPVLQAIRQKDTDLHDRIVQALVDLALDRPTAGASLDVPSSARSRRNMMELGVSLAEYSQLQTEPLKKLAAHPFSMVRKALASRQECSLDMLTLLATDSDSSVRSAIARRPDCPRDVLMLLASDPDEWIRRDVYANESGTDEVRVAVALSSSHEQIGLWKSMGAPAAGEEQSHSGFGISQDHVASLKEMPSDWDPLVATPSYHACSDRRAVWNADRLRMWPSTVAYLMPTTPLWILEFFAQHGHPAALLDSRMPEPFHSVELDSSQQLKQLVDSRLLIRALWRELALLDLLHFVFVLDYLGWPHLMPRDSRGDLLGLGSAAEYIISGGEVGEGSTLEHDEEWVQVETSLSQSSSLVALNEIFDYWIHCQDEYVLDVFEDDEVFSDSVEVDGPDKTLARFALSGLAYVHRQLGVSLITPEGLGAIKHSLIFPPYDEMRDLSGYEFEVSIGGSDLPWISYSDSTHSKMEQLVDLLKAGETDPVVREWGVSSHFLACVAMHPATPNHVRVRCQTQS